ncbi:MAG TPA: hypothetical protein VGS18_02515, partial [Thermoplasmata archaeon]|nr:hypothetical protein [Thermoplasmata archaeon]
YLLVFDVSRGMGMGPIGGTALDRAVDAGWALASLVARAGEDRIALLARVGDTVDFLPAGRGQLHLAAVQDRLARLEVRDGAFDLSRTLLDVLPRLKTHTHVFVFSSLDAPLLRLGGAYRRFVSKGHRLTLLTPEAARLYPAGWLAGRAESEWWARRLESARLQRRLEALRAIGIAAVRYDARTATSRLLASYGEMRAWGRGS